MPRPLRVFLSYASQDKQAVHELYNALKSEKWIDPWLDRAKILPGQDWETVIEKAVGSSDVVLACVSSNSVSKEGFIQREIRYAYEIALEKPKDTIFLIPLRLDDCNMPRMLRSLQWVDYFGDEKNNTYLNLLKALRLRYTQKLKFEEEELTRTETEEQAVSELVEKAYRERLELEARKKAALEAAQKSAVEKLELELKKEKRNTKNETYTWERIFAPAVAFVATIYKGIEFIIKKRTTNVLPEQIVPNLNVSQEQFSPYPNPYVVGNPVDPDSNRRMFFGRSDIVQIISREIKEPSQKPSLLLYGRRRMGKTSALLNLGRYIKGLNIVHIFISAQDIKNRTDSDLTFNLINQVIEKLKEATFSSKLFENQTYYMSEDIYKNNPIRVLSSFIGDCHTFLEETNTYCLFMFDEYELLGETISKDFFLQIRNTMQHKSRFVFLFAGSHMPNEVKNSNWMEVFMNVKVLRISFLDRQDSYRLLTEPVPNLVYASEDLINKILDITGCQPLLLQSMATEIINRLNATKRKAVDESVVNYAIEKTLDAWGFNFFTHLWENDCDARADKELLKKIVSNNSSIKKSYLEKYASSLKKLVERDLLKIEGEYVKLTMPIVKRWIQRENPKIQ